MQQASRTTTRFDQLFARWDTTSPTDGCRCRDCCCWWWCFTAWHLRCILTSETECIEWPNGVREIALSIGVSTVPVSGNQATLSPAVHYSPWKGDTCSLLQLGALWHTLRRRADQTRLIMPMWHGEIYWQMRHEPLLAEERSRQTDSSTVAVCLLNWILQLCSIVVVVQSACTFNFNFSLLRYIQNKTCTKICQNYRIYSFDIVSTVTAILDGKERSEKAHTHKLKYPYFFVRYLDNLRTSCVIEFSGGEVI